MPPPDLDRLVIRAQRGDGAALELNDLVRLGELHRAHARRASADGAMRALHRVAPTLAA